VVATVIVLAMQRAAVDRVRILVCDDDAWMLRTVRLVLEQRGHEVETAGNGRDGLAAALERPPDLLITDVMMPMLDGWSLVRTLRAESALAPLPVIFLTALSGDDDRIQGFRLGADHYLTKPFRFEELDLRVTSTLRRTRALVDDARQQLGTPCFSGRLEQVGLASLLVLVELERKTGRLLVRSAGGAGEVGVRDGRVIRAELADGSAADAPCVHRLLTWSAGEFVFLPGPVDGPDRVDMTTTHLLLEGARLLDQARR
jgi:DNA-binding response OmpR family regulator